MLLAIWVIVLVSWGWCLFVFGVIWVLFLVCWFCWLVVWICLLLCWFGFAVLLDVWVGWFCCGGYSMSCVVDGYYNCLIRIGLFWVWVVG